MTHNPIPAADAIKRHDPKWPGGHAPTHKAIDDARGYAHLLARLMQRAPC